MEIFYSVTIIDSLLLLHDCVKRILFDHLWESSLFFRVSHIVQIEDNLPPRRSSSSRHLLTILWAVINQKRCKIIDRVWAYILLMHCQHFWFQKWPFKGNRIIERIFFIFSKVFAVFDEIRNPLFQNPTQF